MEIREIEDSVIWDSLVRSMPMYSFLNSSARFNYVKEYFKNGGRIAIYNDDTLIGVCNWYVIHSKIPYIYTQHSPLVVKQEDSKEFLKTIITYLKTKAKQLKCAFIQLSPLTTDRNFLPDTEYKLSPVANTDALITLHIDVTKSVEDLRMEMSSSCKNNVNKLTKDPNITTKIYNDDSQIELFLKLLKETQKDKNYYDKSDEMFKYELTQYAKAGMLYSTVGYLNNEPIGIRVNVKFGNVLTDYQASISSLAREKGIRIAYRLAYETMLLAKDLGCSYWDMFGGMTPENSTDHPWKGVEEFKLSFGGSKITYAHPIDIPINKVLYPISYIYRKYRTEKAGFTIDW